MKIWFAVALVLATLFGVVPAKADLLSSDDEKIYRQAFEAAHNDHYDWALAAAAKAHNKLLGKVLRWMNYTQPNSGAGFAEITAFIQANPTWPQVSTLMRRAEEALTAATPDTLVLDWFAGHPPQTVDGAMAFGRALVNAGQDDKAEKILRDAWIAGNFGPMQERQFLANFEDLLTTDDQIARLDRLLWEHQDSGAAHQMLRVDEHHRQLARARMALANDASNGESLAAGVAEPLKDDPGLIYELVRYRRDHDKDEQAIELLKNASANKVHPDLWWIERAILARRALQQGRISQAYDIARAHGQSGGSSFADAEWLSGWIALRFLGDQEVALRHFTRMYDQVSTPQSLSRAAYWAGRACDMLGKGDDALRWYDTAAHQVTTFYGQLAASRLNRDQLWPLPVDPLPRAEDIEQFERHELVRVARMLGQIEIDLI